MIVYLAGLTTPSTAKREFKKIIHNEFNELLPISEMNCLESYFYLKNDFWIAPLINNFKSFILDSGAFTFMTSAKGKIIDWERYVICYGEFVKQHDIRLFFELDIDPIGGIERYT